MLGLLMLTVMLKTVAPVLSLLTMLSTMVKTVARVSLLTMVSTMSDDGLLSCRAAVLKKALMVDAAVV